jgi:hypothetical protein
VAESFSLSGLLAVLAAFAVLAGVLLGRQVAVGVKRRRDERRLTETALRELLSGLERETIDPKLATDEFRAICDQARENRRHRER